MRDKEPEDLASLSAAVLLLLVLGVWWLFLALGLFGYGQILLVVVLIIASGLIVGGCVAHRRQFGSIAALIMVIFVLLFLLTVGVCGFALEGMRPN